jgi:hypothetical protein
MWLIIRAAFCVGMVFSMTPGAETIGENGGAAAALTAVAGPGMRDLVNGALSACKGEPALCLEAAQRLASLSGDALAQPSKIGAPDSVKLVADTLTAADRSAPWHGNAKAAKGSARAREVSRPAT